jgi:dTDP-4-dehydrorhamnose reductase
VRLYVTGADGTLGTALADELRENPATAAWPVRGVSIHDFDIGDADAVQRSIAQFRPDVVLHLAAISIVADCELEPERALRVNVAGVRNVAEACRLHDVRLVYISTDYVFDGASPARDGYRETDVPNPLSLYGLTKLAGERIAATLPDHLIIRTSWLFGGALEDTDEVLASVRLAQRAQRAQLIADQFATPTYVNDLAQAMVRLLLRDEPVTGTLHITNAGTTSRYEMGIRAVRAFDPALVPFAPEPVAYDDCALVGRRPRVSALNTGRLAGLGYALPHWRDAMDRFCARLQAAQPSGPLDAERA